jgi:UDP-glucose 4-epimerase
MKKYDVNNIVFSSSATVYGMAKNAALTEDDTARPINTYAATKSNIEDLLYFTSISDKNLIVSSLRYFNPIGAHESGLIGDAPTGYPNNLLPFIGDVAIGKREKLNVFGNDYNTPDGTCIRDYIHVVDLANAHLAALENNKNPGFTPFNIGTGRGTSVLEMVNAFEKATGVKIPYEIVGRRAGDAEICYADASKANKYLNWHAVYDVETMCRDYWNFKKNN